MSGYYCLIAIAYGRTSTFIVGVSFGTFATIAIDRYLARGSSSLGRELVKLSRVVCILLIEWISTSLWSGSLFLSVCSDQ